MNRRTLLAAVGAGALSLAGCSSRADSGSDDPTETTETSDLPDSCPTTQDLGVEWPDELTAETVESFVAAYEQAYYREKVVEYEPETSLDSYELGGTVSEGPTETGAGWTVTYDGSGGVYRPSLLLEATQTTVPEERETVPVSEVDDEPLGDLLAAAADNGDDELRLSRTGKDIEAYLTLFESASADFESPSEPGDSDVLYVDVDGTTVELTVQATSFHGDYWWSAQYYVDETVVRRTEEQDADPRGGTLLECRTDG